MSREYGGEDRIAAQIVTGIGFLGAGLIFREGVTIKGVTTAATIWTVAAVGVAIGIEGYLVAVFASLLAVIVLELRVITKNIRPSHDEDEAGRPDNEMDGIGS
jgi:putative Mg2+ transporter-C (MgtC) family protein